jgi:hypothetical protein
MTRRQVKGDAVRRELLPGESVELLKALHVLTRDGNLNADSLRKLKQVNHLAQLLAPAVDDLLGRFGDPVFADLGAGKSYLGFVLYELFLKAAGKGTLLAVESRPELVAKASEIAAKLGYGRMRFVGAAIDQAELPERLHLVTALHACDTATDDALLLAIRRTADHVASPAARRRLPGSSPPRWSPRRSSRRSTSTPGTGASSARTSPTSYARWSSRPRDIASR